MSFFKNVRVTPKCKGTRTHNTVCGLWQPIAILSDLADCFNVTRQATTLGTGAGPRIRAYFRYWAQEVSHCFIKRWVFVIVKDYFNWTLLCQLNTHSFNSDRKLSLFLRYCNSTVTFAMQSNHVFLFRYTATFQFERGQETKGIHDSLLQRNQHLIFSFFTARGLLMIPIYIYIIGQRNISPFLLRKSFPSLLYLSRCYVTIG